jgi:glucoamylase
VSTEGDPKFPAPGAPGGEPRWTSSAKSGVGTSISAQSPVWFTLSHGIVNEVYYPRLDQANIRDLGFIVTDGAAFFSEEKRHTTTTIETLHPGVPAYQLTNTCSAGRYRIHKTVFTDPRRACVLQRIRFEPLQGTRDHYQLFVLLAPHLGNHGAENNGWLGDHKGMPMLFAERNGTALALACSRAWLKRSCGYVGTSDGWQDLHATKSLSICYSEARNGNIALCAQIDLGSTDGEFVLVLAFGSNAAEAGARAHASVLDLVDALLQDYVLGWQAFQEHLLDLPRLDASPDLYRVSTAVTKIHQSKHFVGGTIASLSIPWGGNKGDNDLGGYHLVWPRDQVESAGALLASGDTAGALDVLRYLLSSQEADGHWAQNMWLDGTTYWSGIQLDETAFPFFLPIHFGERKPLAVSRCGQPYAVLPAISSETGPQRFRIAGRKTPAIHRLRSPSSSRHFWLPQTSPMREENTRSAPISKRPPTYGTLRSRAGRM